jgi:hypothetical protein
LAHPQDEAPRFAAACDAKAGDIVQAWLSAREDDAEREVLYAVLREAWLSARKDDAEHKVLLREAARLKEQTGWAYATVSRIKGTDVFVTPLGLSIEVSQACDAL